ncbi:hypothetical protein DLAC_06518 [Tieghemostelium lacteum]|uniref:Saposin B-type domain-containing protein n=1 Tax=Tieghemostelium lacteum TaxID=361077 RepID=A0A151ZF28_TIELA|nr:hypothetical protein DLAC_06518 [Tieghemostelium lacteum]|eukprot:KYQ92527.1 hypothetical protein DLAC_06518 [Tieghemostelium lacteum]
MNKLLICIVLALVTLSLANAAQISVVVDGKLNPQVVKSNIKLNNGTVQCDICEVVVEAAEFLIKNGNYTQQQVEAELKKICTILPSNFTKECDFFMFFSAPVITAALFNGENADQLCTKYKICTDDSGSKGAEDVPTMEQPIVIANQGQGIKPNLLTNQIHNIRKSIVEPMITNHKKIKINH